MHNMAFAPPPTPKFNLHSFSLMRSSESHLLQQQKDALKELVQWFQPGSANTENIAIVSMPTGSGKTGIISCLPYYLGSIGLIEPQNLFTQPTGDPLYLFDKPVLVIAPNLEITEQLERELSGTEAFLVRQGIVPEENNNHILPMVKKIENTAQLRDQNNCLKKYEMIIANVQNFLISDDMNDWQQLPSDLFRLIIVHEAHHYPAPTWQRMVETFKDAAVVFFTATPYRSDKKQVLENTPVTYHLKLADAVSAGIIRQTNFEELEGTGDLKAAYMIPDRHYSDEDKADMQRMVTVVKKVKELLDSKNTESPLPGGVKHMAMAITSEIDGANRLHQIWKEIYHNSPAEVYHSKIPNREEIMDRIKKNELCLVIVVDMLKEGFDYPPISIAVITRAIRSSVLFTQFIGRAQRICRGPEGTEENVLADIITHADYKQSQNYEDFVEENLIPVDNSDYK